MSFTVSPLEGNQVSFELSEVMVVNKLPMRKCNVLNWEELSSWDYLEDLEIPELKDKSVHLLIGTNHALTSVPMESLYSSKGSPVAVKTPWSWTLYGPMLKSVKHMRHADALVSLHIEENDGAQGDVTILAPREYIEEGELKCDNLREDRIALARMKSDIILVDGHF